MVQLKYLQPWSPTMQRARQPGRSWRSVTPLGPTSPYPPTALFQQHAPSPANTAAPPRGNGSSCIQGKGRSQGGGQPRPKRTCLPPPRKYPIFQAPRARRRGAAPPLQEWEARNVSRGQSAPLPPRIAAPPPPPQAKRDFVCRTLWPASFTMAHPGRAGFRL